MCLSVCVQLKWCTQCIISIAHCTRYSVTQLISCWFDLEKLFGRTEKSYRKGLCAAERFRDLQLHICIYGRNATQYKAKYHLLMIVTFSSICICIENINKTLCTKLKGLFTIFLFSVRSHILNNNGLWYSWFCPISNLWSCESRSHVALGVEVPGDKIKNQKIWVWGVYRPLRAKSAIPHPITIQNMRSDQK